jgi:hypothetical protein
MDIIKDVEAVAEPVLGVTTSVANPIGLYLKLAGAAVLVAGIGYGAYRLNSFVETAAEDHAARAVLTIQRDTALATVEANLVNDRKKADQVQAEIAAANTNAAKSKDRAAQLQAKLEAVNANPSVNCRLSPAARSLLGSRMH